MLIIMFLNPIQLLLKLQPFHVMVNSCLLHQMIKLLKYGRLLIKDFNYQFKPIQTGSETLNFHQMLELSYLDLMIAL